MKLRAAFALSSLLIASLIACGPPPAANTARKVGKEARVDGNSPTPLSDVKFDESPAGGDPKIVGCADGQREGFADLAKFPTVAGCLGSWEGAMSLRKGTTRTACGDDSEVCKSPADVCAEGWHVCGRTGNPAELSKRIDDKGCSAGAGPGKFVAAISHVRKKKECPPPPKSSTRYPCLNDGWGAEPVCCGKDCRAGKCRDGVWEGKTRISVGQAQGCGSVSSDRNGGIMCCKDEDKRPLPSRIEGRPVDPPADTAAPTLTPQDDAKPKGDDKPKDDAG